MASTPNVTQPTSSTSGTSHTFFIIVGVVVGVVVAFLAGIIILRLRYLRRRKAQPRRQNTIERRANDKLTSNFHVHRRDPSPLSLDDWQRKKESNYTTRHAIYEPTYSPYDPPYRGEEKYNSLEEDRGRVDERSASPRLSDLHSPTKVTLPRLVIPEFRPLAMTGVLGNSFNSSSPTSEGIGSSHPSSAATESSNSAYSQSSARTGRLSIIPPVPSIPDQFKSTVADDPSAMTRTNTRVIGLLLKQRAKRPKKSDTTSRSPSPVSPIERSGSINSTYSRIIDQEDEKPSLKSRLATRQRRKTLPTPQMEPLLEVPGSAVSSTTTPPFPVTSWQFPAPPALPTPTSYTTSPPPPSHPAAPLSSMSRQSFPDQRHAVDVLYADISPLKVSKPRDRDPPTRAEEILPYSGQRVHFRDRSAERALDISYPMGRFQSTHGEIEYHHM